MAVVEFKGFAGTTLRAGVRGNDEDPAVLLLHSAGQTRAVWSDAAQAMVRAGRRVVNLDLRGHGESEWPADGRYDFDAYVEDIRAVLRQLPSRPVIVAASFSGWIATVALGEGFGHLADGLILADVPPELDEEAAARIAARLRQQAHSGERLDWDPALLRGMDPAEVIPRFVAATAMIGVPTLFVRGARSEVTQLDAAAELVADMHDAELIEVENAGHLVAAERTDEFNATLLDFLERKVPRFPPEYKTGSDTRTLRDSMGCFATGVTVVTAMAEDGTPVGLTANSFTSVSLEPPLLLVCIANTVGSRPVFETAEHFAVNVLHMGQQPVSNRFSRPGEDRFGETDWEAGESGAPVLPNSLANYECARHALYDGGDHIILVGRVLRGRYEPHRDPLLYFRGKYARLHMG